MGAASQQRLAIIDRYFPGWKNEMWHKRDEKGYAQIPRTIPLICALIKNLTKNLDPSRVYLDLWFRMFPEAHLLEVRNPREFAYASCLKVEGLCVAGRNESSRWRRWVLLRPRSVSVKNTRSHP